MNQDEVNQREKFCRKALRNFIEQTEDKGNVLISVIRSHLHSLIVTKNYRVRQQEQEDIVQEAIMKIFKSHKQLKVSCVGWVRSIVTTTCQNTFRKPVESRDAIEMTSIAEDELLDVLNSYDEVECFQAILREIAKSRSGKDDLFILQSYASGSSSHDIAQALNRTPQAIDQRLFMIRKKMHSLKGKLC